MQFTKVIQDKDYSELADYLKDRYTFHLAQKIHNRKEEILNDLRKNRKIASSEVS